MEIGIKTANRILLGNVNPITRKMGNDKTVKALTMHRNTPGQQFGISSAIALSGRPIRYHLPFRNIKLQKMWQEIADKQDDLLAKQHLIQTVPQPELKRLLP